MLVSRALDDIEETTNRNKATVPREHLVLYQFSARGHEMAQAILGSMLDRPHDGVGAYYRSRPLLLSLGLEIEDALASPLGRSGGFSDGRDIGVVCNLPMRQGPMVLPMSGDVGSQYTPVAGWAQAIRYYRDGLGDASYDGSIAVAHGGEASVATNGFWSALTLATTLELPVLFYIEDNGLGIPVRARNADAGRQHCAEPGVASATCSFGWRRDGPRRRRADCSTKACGTCASGRDRRSSDSLSPAYRVTPDRTTRRGIGTKPRSRPNGPRSAAKTSAQWCPRS